MHREVLASLTSSRAATVNMLFIDAVRGSANRHKDVEGLSSVGAVVCADGVVTSVAWSAFAPLSSRKLDPRRSVI